MKRAQRTGEEQKALLQRFFELRKQLPDITKVNLCLRLNVTVAVLNTYIHKWEGECVCQT